MNARENKDPLFFLHTILSIRFVVSMWMMYLLHNMASLVCSYH